MNFGGVIAGAMEGGAKVVGNMAQGYIDDERKAGLAQIESDIALSRAKSLEMFKQHLADKSRASRAADVDKRASALLDQQVADKLNAKYGQGSALTPADVSDEERQWVGISDADRAAARQRAMREGGWIDPAHELQFDARVSGIEAQNQRLMQNIEHFDRMQRSREGIAAANRDSREGIASANRDSREDIADANREARAKGSADSGKLLSPLNTAVQALQKDDRQFSRDPAVKQAWQAELRDVQERRSALIKALKSREWAAADSNDAAKERTGLDYGAAAEIKAQLKASKITRDEAIRKLQFLGFN